MNEVSRLKTYIIYMKQTCLNQVCFMFSYYLVILNTWFKNSSYSPDMLLNVIRAFCWNINWDSQNKFKDLYSSDSHLKLNWKGVSHNMLELNWTWGKSTTSSSSYLNDKGNVNCGGTCKIFYPMWWSICRYFSADFGTR